MIQPLKHRTMKESRLNIHITFEEEDFLWDKRNVLWFRKMWNEGEGAAKDKHGYQIQIVRSYTSDKSLKEIMAMD
ncbi:helix-turn-helix domain containing protein [Bacillus cereus]|uniref:helix-turn-helix domain containing protein n=1 Tax=Bacillus cereus TaxID=1396 RepID=UPI000BF74A91|nr:helix-turn-helix domain containing protein [Bacillus cereus]PER91137.1 helix-turn-helix domain containing protein [Bacillus cereus]